MKTQGIQKVVQKLTSTINQNSPIILTGVAVAGLISTTILAVKATPKAMRILDAERKYRAKFHNDDIVDPIYKRDAIALTWKCYIPSIMMGGVTIGCIVGANSINTRRNAALAGLYSLTETAFKEYQTKMIETIGENKEMKIRDEIAKDRLAANPLTSPNGVIITGNGDVLCYDAPTDRYFKSDIEKIRQSINDLNERLISEMSLSLNEFYYALGLKETPLGDDLGFHIDKGQIKVTYSSQLAQNGQPCLVLNYQVYPMR